MTKLVHFLSLRACFLTTIILLLGGKLSAQSCTHISELLNVSINGMLMK